MNRLRMAWQRLTARTRWSPAGMIAFVLVVVGLLLGTTLVCRDLAAEEIQGGERIRIGTYDSRAIAIAYAASRFNPVKEKTAAYEKAKAAGDSQQMKELEAWGEQHQRQLHFQGFARVPVDDLLAPVKDQVAKLARERKLAAITMGCDFKSGEVELVDVTDELVKLYDPSEKTLGHVRGIRNAKPSALTQIADMPAKH